MSNNYTLELKNSEDKVIKKWTVVMDEDDVSTITIANVTVVDSVQMPLSEDIS